MKKLLLFICLSLYAVSAFAGGELKVGETFTDHSLPRPMEQNQAEYLGLGPDAASFAIQDLRAELVLVEFFSMYCPHCQHEAPLVNEVYGLIKKNGLDKKITMVGIGIGNSDYEVGIFQEKFTIPFPLFSDEPFIWHKKVGEVGTPYFVLVRNENGVSTVVWTHLGRMDSASAFFTRIKKYI